MSLNVDLANIFSGVRANAPAIVVARIEAGIDRLNAARTGAEAPKPGDKAPVVTVSAPDGATVPLVSLYRDRPLVLVFYRGRWCPFCDLALRAYETANADFASAGAALAAISPQTAAQTDLTASERSLHFPLYSDPGNAAAQAFGLTWQMNGEERELAAGFDVQLDTINGDDRWELPAPATFIIDRAGVVRWASVNPDYTQRAEPADVLQALRALKLGEVK